MDSKQVTESAGGVVLNWKGEILVVNQNGDSWSLPKGHVDPGEDALTAAKREIHEESGITDLTLLGDLGTYERGRIRLGGGEIGDQVKRITLFLFVTSQTRLHPLDPRNPQARWVERTQVAKLLTHPKDKEFFTDLLPQLPPGGVT